MYLPAGRLAGSNESPVSPAVEGARFTPFSRPATRFSPLVKPSCRASFSAAVESTGTVISSAFKASFLGVLLWMAWCCFRLPCRENIHGGLSPFLPLRYLSGEPTVAVWTLERPLLRVRPHVDLKSAGASKHLDGWVVLADDANPRMTSWELP